MARISTFGSAQVITALNGGAITHQLPAVQVSRYITSVVASIALAALAGANGFVMGTFFICYGAELTQADVDALDFNSDLPQILSGKVASVLYQHVIAGPGSFSAHFGDVPNGPMLVPPGNIITAGFTRPQTGTPASPAALTLATITGWDADGKRPLWGTDPRLRDLR